MLMVPATLAAFTSTAPERRKNNVVTMSSRIMRLRAAAVGIAIITSGLVLSVAGNANAQTVAHAPRITHAAVVKPRFDVICSGDVCIQTTSKNATTASVRTWPDTVSFIGHFELVNGCGGVFGNSTEGDKFYQSGGTGFTFSGIHWADCMVNIQAAFLAWWPLVAWRGGPFVVNWG